MNSQNRVACSTVHATKPAIEKGDDIVSSTLAESLPPFSELHAAYSRRLYKTIIAITKNPEDAEDALQETFLRGYLAFHTFEGRSSIYSWLTRIAVNSALLILRKRRARPEILFDPQPDPLGEPSGFEVRDTAPNPEQIYEQRQRRARLLQAIRSLDVQLRMPIQLQMAKGSSMKEISSALNISEAAVKTRLHRARRKLIAPWRER